MLKYLSTSKVYDIYLTVIFNNISSLYMVSEQIYHICEGYLRKTGIFRKYPSQYDIIIPFCRLSITNDSYSPSTIRQWNNLDLSIRNVGSMLHFKSELKKLSTSYSVNIPKYYSYGPRKLNIVLTQFRCSTTFKLWSV